MTKTLAWPSGPLRIVYLPVPRSQKRWHWRSEETEKTMGKGLDLLPLDKIQMDKSYLNDWIRCGKVNWAIFKDSILGKWEHWGNLVFKHCSLTRRLFNTGRDRWFCVHLMNVSKV